MPLEFEKLSAQTLESLPSHQTVFFFSVGPLEEHGPHLPMGLDLLEAKKLCQMSAEKLETDLPGWIGILMPAAPLGVEANTQRLALTVRSHVLRDWLIDACRSLKRMGFYHFVCFSGHLGPKQLTAIEDAAKIISRRSLWSWFLNRNRKISPYFSLISASSALTSLQDMKKSPFWPDPVEHGGEQDTSIALATAPDSVSNTYLSLTEIHRPSSCLFRIMHRIRKQTQGYWGSPALGDLQKGNQAFNGIIQDLFPKLRAVWEGANPNQLFRSWYSILPPNKSFIKGWILAFILLATIWAYLTLIGVGMDSLLSWHTS